MTLKNASLLILLVIVVTIAFQNYSVDSFKLFMWDFRTSKAVVIFVSMIFGVIIGHISSRK